MFEFIRDPLHGLARQLGMNDKENMHEVRFPNVYTLSHVIYYIVPLTLMFSCFRNENSRFFKGQTNSQYYICNALW